MPVPLEMVAQTLRPGRDGNAAARRLGRSVSSAIVSGVLNVSSMKLSLPTADAAAISSTATTAEMVA